MVHCCGWVCVCNMGLSGAAVCRWQSHCECVRARFSDSWYFIAKHKISPGPSSESLSLITGRRSPGWRSSSAGALDDVFVKCGTWVHCFIQGDKPDDFLDSCGCRFILASVCLDANGSYTCFVNVTMIKSCIFRILACLASVELHMTSGIT